MKKAPDFHKYHYGVRDDEEDAAWTMGYLMRKTVTLVGEPCRREMG